MTRIITSFMFIVFFLTGCFNESVKNNIKENALSKSISTNYYSDKSVTALDVPPDLTSPTYEKSFKLSDYVDGIDANTINLTNKNISNENKKEKILINSIDIKVKKFQDRRWLLVHKDSETVWSLTEQFFKDKGFTINKSNKKIGLMETNFLEKKKPILPKKSLGLIRSFLSQADAISYTLPTADKYKIRIEPVDDESTEIHLAISSMAEVIDKTAGRESTIWQVKDRDINVENEMLLNLMVFLGSDSANAREEIINAKEQERITVKLLDGLNGYAKLLFNSNLTKAWDNLLWGLLSLDIEIEDRDFKEKSIYIRSARSSDIGIFSKILGDEPLRKSYQITLKQIKPEMTEVYFNDISEKNEIETKEFSYEFLGKIQKLF